MSRVDSFVMQEYEKLYNQYQHSGSWGTLKDMAAWAVLHEFVNSIDLEYYLAIKESFRTTMEFRVTNMTRLGLCSL